MARELEVQLVASHEWSPKSDGVILGQDPFPGSPLPAGPIYVTVSKGFLFVPDVGVRSIQGAKRALRRAGFEVRVVWRNHHVLSLLSDRPQPIGTHPSAFSEARPGSVVTLVAYRPLPSPESACDPSYPDVCIPSPPPDLDCPQVSYTNIRVVGPDPHGFDGYDNDGVGCET